MTLIDIPPVDFTPLVDTLTTHIDARANSASAALDATTLALATQLGAVLGELATVRAQLAALDAKVSAPPPPPPDVVPPPSAIIDISLALQTKLELIAVGEVALLRHVASGAEYTIMRYPDQP
jgi:hypothetical protein